MFMLDATGIFLRIFSGIFSESFLGIFSGIFFYFFENILNTDILDQKERFFWIGIGGFGILKIFLFLLVQNVYIQVIFKIWDRKTDPRRIPIAYTSPFSTNKR